MILCLQAEIGAQLGAYFTGFCSFRPLFFLFYDFPCQIHYINHGETRPLFEDLGTT
jgi:hypothetical protein